MTVRVLLLSLAGFQNLATFIHLLNMYYVPIILISDMGTADDNKMKTLLSINFHQLGAENLECTRLKRN